MVFESENSRSSTSLNLPASGCKLPACLMRKRRLQPERLCSADVFRNPSFQASLNRFPFRWICSCLLIEPTLKVGEGRRRKSETGTHGDFGRPFPCAGSRFGCSHAAPLLSLRTSFGSGRRAGEGAAAFWSLQTDSYQAGACFSVRRPHQPARGGCVRGASSRFHKDTEL